MRHVGKLSVKLADGPGQAREIAQQMLGMNLKGFIVKSVLVEQALPIDKEYYLSFTGEMGGLWRNRGRPPQKLVGVGFVAQGLDVSSYYRRKPDSFEQGAATATSAVRLRYKINPRITLQLQTGTNTALDVLYSWAFD